MYLKTISNNDYQYIRVFERSVLFMQNDSPDAILISTIAHKRDYEIDDMLKLYIMLPYKKYIVSPKDDKKITVFMEINDIVMDDSVFLIIKDGKIIKKDYSTINGKTVGAIEIVSPEKADPQYPCIQFTFENLKKAYSILNPDGELDLKVLIDRDATLEKIAKIKDIDPKKFKTMNFPLQYNDDKSEINISMVSWTDGRTHCKFKMDLDGNIIEDSIKINL